MSKHHHTGGRGWRSNGYNNYPSQRESYQEDIVSSAGPHRHVRPEQSQQFELDDRRMPEGASWEPSGYSSHLPFPGEPNRPHRNEQQGLQPNRNRFPMADRKPPFWAQQEQAQAHYHNAAFTRDEPQGPHFHNKGDMPQQWRGPQQEPTSERRERDIEPTPTFDRGRTGRRMDWEPPFQQPARPDQHANGPNPGFQQHNNQHPEAWNHPNDWQDNSSRWPQHQRRQSFEVRQPLNQQNRRNHAFSGPRHNQPQNFSRSSQWNRSATNAVPPHHNDTKDHRSSDDYPR